MPIGPDHPSYAIFALKAKTDPAFARLLADEPLDTSPPAPPSWDEFVTIPEPPKWQGTPTKPHAVVTVAGGKEGQELLAISRPLFEMYAKKIDADLVILDWLGVAEWPISSKFALRSVLPHYQRIIFFDADILVHPDTPNLLNGMPPGTVGMYDDLPEILRSGRVFIDEYQDFREHVGLQRLAKVDFYGNTGLMVLDRSHLPVLDVPPVPIPALHCSEQHLFVARVVDLDFPLFRLGKVYNWQWWTDRGFRRAPANACLHYAGMQHKGGHEERLSHMAGQAARMLGRAAPVSLSRPRATVNAVSPPCGSCGGKKEPLRVR